MNFDRHRSGTARTLAGGLCWVLLLGIPGPEAYAATARELTGGDILGVHPIVAPVDAAAPDLQVPRLDVVLPLGSEVAALDTRLPGANIAASAQVLSAASAVSATAQTATATAAPITAQAALRAGGETIARAQGEGASPSAIARAISWIFGERGSSGNGGDDSAKPSSVSDDRVKFYIAEQGKPTISGKLSELGPTLKDHPEVAARLNVVRLATAKKDKTNPHDGLTPEDAARVSETVGAAGVQAKLEVERVPVDWQRALAAKAASKGGQGGSLPLAGAKRSPKELVLEAARNPVRTAVNVVTWPAREAVFVVKTYLAGVSAPTRQELIGAALTKIPPAIIGVGIWWKMIGPSHPILLASAIGLSLAWEAFHGVLLNSWNSFQNSLYKLRGGRYQTNFNWLYGQMNPAIFRLMSWSVDHNDPSRVPPWNHKYWFNNWNPLTVAFWFAMGPISVVGTFIGTIAYRGLNTLYETGRLTRAKRSYIQQGRDFVMMLTGFLLGAGMAKYYVLFFLMQQAFDVGTYAVSLRAKGRPVLYVVDETVAATKEFNEMYPVAPNPVVVPPLKQALTALGDIPLLYPITLPIKLGRWLWSKRKK